MSPTDEAQIAYREACLKLLNEADWHGLYKMAMAWRVAGGGMWTPDAWLMDICSSLLHNQPKTAVHCCDMALRTWIERPLDRLTMRYLRGLLILDHVRDPARSIDDLQSARHAQPWLAALADEDSKRAELASLRSKIKAARTGPSPAFTREHRASHVAPAAQPFPEDGAIPALWRVALPRIRAQSAAD
jgi:hypothetical protein